MNPEGVIRKEDMAFSGRFLGAKYEIKKTNPEQLEKWLEEVGQFSDAIRSKDIKRIIELVGQDHRLFDFEEIQKALNEEDVIDDETAKLWGVGMWLMKNQPRWPGNTPVLKKILSSETHNISDAIDKDAVGNCMDSAVLARELARRLGCEGDIKMRDLVHRYLDSGTGILVDPWWAMPRGGIVRTWVQGDVNRWKNPGANFGDKH